VAHNRIHIVGSCGNSCVPSSLGVECYSCDWHYRCVRKAVYSGTKFEGLERY